MAAACDRAAVMVNILGAGRNVCVVNSIAAPHCCQQDIELASSLCHQEMELEMEVHKVCLLGGNKQVMYAAALKYPQAYL